MPPGASRSACAGSRPFARTHGRVVDARSHIPCDTCPDQTVTGKNPWQPATPGPETNSTREWNIVSSTCVLPFGDPCIDVAKLRLKITFAHHDGSGTARRSPRADCYFKVKAFLKVTDALRYITNELPSVVANGVHTPNVSRLLPTGRPDTSVWLDAMLKNASVTT